MPDNRDDLDRILDSALSTYAAQEPWPGIEQRVVEGVARAKRQRGYLLWALPVPILAAALVILALWLRPDDNPPVTVQRRAANTGTRPEAPPRPAGASKPARPLPGRRSVFPTPSPLTTEERALLQLAASHPDVIQDVLAVRERSDQPVMVEPITIPLLTNSDAMED